MAAKNSIPAVKGMREFYPEDLAVRNYLYQKVRQAASLFGYQEWESPYVETIALYAAKSGEELVEKQSFVFSDRGGDKITLRPELTPSLARMVAKRQSELTFPLRWWQFGPMWRYEQPQKGRTREFFQWNVDMLGVNSPEADAEIIAIAASFLKLAGLTSQQAVILVNNRRLMDAQFDALGIAAEQRLFVSGLVDRRGKMKAEAWETYALENGLRQDQLDGLEKILADFNLWQQSDELVRLFRALKALGVDEYVKFDPNIMRGLLYYTGTVFEAFDVSGSLRRAILGGGRYDKLLADVGGEALSGVGFAMGDVVIGIILQEKGLLPPFTPSPAPALVTIFDEDSWLEAFSLAAALRAAGLNVAVYPEPAKLPKQFKFADRMGIRVAVVVGPEEAAAGQVTLKDLKTGQQQAVSRAQSAAAIAAILASQ